MRAVHLVQPGCLELRDVPTPTPGEGEIVVRVEAALTCGTDLKAFRRGHRYIPLPGPFGHEYAGTVVAVGEAVRRFRVGDAVAGVHSAPCFSCYWCRVGQENLCPHLTMTFGAYAEYLRLPAAVVAHNTFLRPANLPAEEAALVEPLACVLHGLAEAPVRPGGTALVLGAGAIGLLHLLVLRQRGLRVMVAARRPVRRELVTRLGGEFVQGAAADLLPAIREATGGRGVDLVVECTGDPAVWEQAPALARRGGHVVLFGGCPDGSRACFDTGRLHYDQVSLSSPFHFTPRDARAAFDLLATRRLDVRPLLTGTIALADLPAHFAALAARDPALATAVKTVVRPSGTTPQGPRGTTGG